MILSTVELLLLKVTKFQRVFSSHLRKYAQLSFLSHFWFFVLAKLSKTKTGCIIFCTMFLVCMARKGRRKGKKNIEKQTNYYVIFSFFINFVFQNEKRKMEWKAQLSQSVNFFNLIGKVDRTLNFVPRFEDGTKDTFWYLATFITNTIYCCVCNFF